MLTPSQMAIAYMDSTLNVPKLWNLSRKHFRFKTFDKKNHQTQPDSQPAYERDLKFYCWKFRPVHGYLSVLDRLFPERVEAYSERRAR